MPPPVVNLPALLPAPHRVRGTLLGTFDELLEDFLEKGGPQPREYGVLSRAIRHLGDAVRAGLLQQEVMHEHLRELTQRHLPGTMQALALAKKYGYSGDFEIIDGIYTQKMCADPHLRCWDLFFHAQAAPVAVRNRKQYFKNLLATHLERKRTGQALHVLNVASGPARDLREFFLDHPEVEAHVDCVDMEGHALSHARELCAPWLDRIEFHHRNVLRHIPTRGYDLAWSAGLFDYLGDRAFVHLLRAMVAVTKPGGEVVVGNFSDFNPSRDYMELMGDWQLRHRSRETLLSLAGQAGISPDCASVFWEPEGVNYFLHLRV